MLPNTIYFLIDHIVSKNPQNKISEESTFAKEVNITETQIKNIRQVHQIFQKSKYSINNVLK